MATKSKSNQIHISRLYDAPVKLVWEAWTDPQKLAQWWGPRGFKITTHRKDMKTGGHWDYTMHGPDGVDYPNHSVFTEIVRPSLIAKTHGGGREGAPGADFHMHATFETVEDNKTLLTMRLTFASLDLRDQIVNVYGAVEGGKQTLDRLATFLEMAEVTA